MKFGNVFNLPVSKQSKYDVTIKQSYVPISALHLNISESFQRFMRSQDPMKDYKILSKITRSY